MTNEKVRQIQTANGLVVIVSEWVERGRYGPLQGGMPYVTNWMGFQAIKDGEGLWYEKFMYDSFTAPKISKFLFEKGITTEELVQLGLPMYPPPSGWYSSWDFFDDGW